MSNSKTAPPILLLLLLASAAISVSASAVNVTAALAAFPSLSRFAALLSPLSSDLRSRSSLTLLAIPNHLLSSSSSSSLLTSSISDVIRSHVLLEYLSPSDLALIPPAGGRLVTTLFQTTGRAFSNSGSLNLTRNPATGRVTAFSPISNATLVSFLKSFPYNLSIFAVDNLLIPYNLDLAASDSHTSPSPSPSLLNITRVLTDAKDFNVAASLIDASGVVSEFEADEKGAGITMFVPTDEAFAGLGVTERLLQSLTAERKAVVLRYHVLHSYYPLGSLESIVNPVQPTLATEDEGAGRFTMNITRVNGSVAIDTGIVQATITRTVFDQNPVSVFAVSRVLLPREIFGGRGMETAAAAPEVVGMQPVEALNGESAPISPVAKDYVRSGVAYVRGGPGRAKSSTIVGSEVVL